MEVILKPFLVLPFGKSSGIISRHVDIPGITYSKNVLEFRNGGKNPAQKAEVESSHMLSKIGLEYLYDMW